MVRTVGLLVVVCSLVLAGCTGVPVDGTDTPTGEIDGDTQNGLLNFYLSDEENVIEEFRHLNVTVTAVGFHKSGENGTWIERDVDNETVDLTELQGAKATKIAEYDLPNGTYTKVFVHVSDVNGTLNATGDSVDVKLPSQKLHINKQFIVNGSNEVDFVYDLSVHKAGQSGMYIIKPVVAQSGTDVPIEPVGEAADERGDDADALNVTFVGEVTPGDNATVEVTRNGSSVENATIAVNGEEVGTTDADGQLTFAVDAEVDELTVAVTHDDQEAELEVEFDADEDE